MSQDHTVNANSVLTLVMLCTAQSKLSQDVCLSVRLPRYANVTKRLNIPHTFTAW